MTNRIPTPDREPLGRGAVLVIRPSTLAVALASAVDRQARWGVHLAPWALPARTGFSER